MIIRVSDELLAEKCDQLLTKLIQDERKYDQTIDSSFIVKDYFKNMINSEDNILLCYRENETVIGYIFLKPIINDSQKGYLVDGLFVEEKYRNKGIAKELINKSLNILNEKKIDFVEINVMYKNELAMKLYKEFGFEEFKVSMRKNISK